MKKTLHKSLAFNFNQTQNSESVESLFKALSTSDVNIKVAVGNGYMSIGMTATDEAAAAAVQQKICDLAFTLQFIEVAPRGY